MSNIDEIRKIDEQKKILEAQEALLLNKALNSDNAEDVVKAMELVTIKKSAVPEEDRKAYYVDPLTFN